MLLELLTMPFLGIVVKWWIGVLGLIRGISWIIILLLAFGVFRGRSILRTPAFSRRARPLVTWFTTAHFFVIIRFINLLNCIFLIFSIMIDFIWWSILFRMMLNRISMSFISFSQSIFILFNLYLSLMPFVIFVDILDKWRILLWTMLILLIWKSLVLILLIRFFLMRLIYRSLLLIITLAMIWSFFIFWSFLLLLDLIMSLFMIILKSINVWHSLILIWSITMMFLITCMAFVITMVTMLLLLFAVLSLFSGLRVAIFNFWWFNLGTINWWLIA